MLLAMLQEIKRGVGRDRSTSTEDRVGLRSVAFEDHVAAVHHDQCEGGAMGRIEREQLVGDLSIV